MFRWLALAVFAASIGISATRRWQARRATGAIPRRREPPVLIAGRLLIALPLFGGMLAYLVEPRWMDWASLDLPPWIRWLGVCLGLLVVPSIYWLLTALGANVSETVLTKPEHRLVTAGPYRWIRHPLYASGLALFLSIGLMAANWFIVLCTIAAAIAIRLVVIPLEEEQLVAAFGDAYRRYRQTTGALIPLRAGRKTAEESASGSGSAHGR